MVEEVTMPDGNTKDFFTAFLDHRNAERKALYEEVKADPTNARYTSTCVSCLSGGVLE